jgi:CheY-like chemotaxis protein
MSVQCYPFHERRGEEMTRKSQATLGSFIRSLRLQHGMTQVQLADQMGVTDKAVSKWERDVSYPDMALFPHLADVLGVNVCDLLNECIEEGQPSRLLQIYSMNHDIRTPLHIMIGYANLAKLHLSKPALLEQDLENIRVSGEYLLRMIEQLMEVTGQQPPGQSCGKERPAASGPEQGTGRTDPGTGSGTDSGTGKGADQGTGNRTDQGIAGGSEQRVDSGSEQDTAAGSDAGADWGSVLQKFCFAGKRILVAEDILLNQEIAGQFLEMAGAAAAFAQDGRMCVEMIENEPAGYYDLVLMDIRMPNMDGLEATRRIRALQDPAKAAIPIIALSANVCDKERQEAFAAGMDDFAEKPIFLEKLFRTIEAHLGRDKHAAGRV